MNRKFLSAALIATFAITGLSFTQTQASAEPPAAFDHRDHNWGRFKVLVRHRGHWDVHGTYRDREDAVRVSRQLERRGFDTRIERVVFR